MSRYFLLTALISLGLGSLLGLRMVLGLSGALPLENWPLLVQSHAALQVKGFMTMLIFGMAVLVLPQLLKVPLAEPRVALLSWGALTTSVLLSLGGGSTPYVRLLEVTSIIAFLFVLRRTRTSAPYHEADPHERRLNKMHAGFMASGILWLLLSAIASSGRSSYEIVLWGFASMYVAGIGLRVHPQMLGLRVGSVSPLVWSLIFWNTGLLLELLEWESGRLLSCGGALLYLLGLSPFRRYVFPPEAPRWLRSYLRVAYGWLLLAIGATVLAPLTSWVNMEATALHLLTSGFLLTMVMGMTFKLLTGGTDLQRTNASAPWALLAILTGGGGLRLAGHLTGSWSIFALGGIFQILASLVFCAIFAVLLLRKSPAVEVML